MFKKSYKGRRVKTVARKSLKIPVTIATSLALVVAVIVSTIINKGLVSVFSDSVTTPPSASSVASESTADLVQTNEQVEDAEDTESSQLEAQSVGTSISLASAITTDTPATVSASAEEGTSNTNTVAISASTGSSLVLSNGNTAGATGSYAAAQMAAATGVSQATWEAIIARESNGDHTATNASGASGLFQTMPGWGSTATVEDQIQTAIKAYNAQGMSAWGY